MNCQEVMELIQRHVDHDLNERETSLMHDHVGQCPDCKALLNRLVLLSQGLEQLPRVEPPYSLVDALLPKLNMHESAESPEAEATTPKAPSSRRRTVSRRTWLMRISSVAAVCAIAAFIAINGSILDQMGIRTHGELATSPESASVNNSFVYDASAGSAGMAEMRAMDQSGSPPERSAPQAVSPDTPVSSKESAPDAIPFQGNANDAGTSSDAPLYAMEGSAEAHEGPSMMGLADMAEEAVSPDGAWRAVLEEGVLIVYAAEGGQAAFRHDPAPGTISGLVWREDGKALDFTFTDAEGHSIAQSLLVPAMEITTR